MHSNILPLLAVILLGVNAVVGISFAKETAAGLFPAQDSRRLAAPQADFESAQGVSWLMTAFILDDYLYLRKQSWLTQSQLGRKVDRFFERPSVQEEEVLLQKFMQRWAQRLPESVQSLQSSTSFFSKILFQDPQLQKNAKYYNYILYQGLGKTHNMALKMIFDLELSTDVRAKNIRILDISNQFLCINGDMQRAAFRILQLFSVSKDPVIQEKVRQYSAILQQKPNMEFWGNLFDPRNWLVAGSAWMMWKGLELSSVVAKFLSDYSNLEKAAAASVGFHVLSYLGLEKVLPHELPKMQQESWTTSSFHTAAPGLVESEIQLFFRNSWTYKNNYHQIQNRIFDWIISGELQAYGEYKKYPFEKMKQVYLQSIQAKQNILDSVLQLKKENKNMDKAGIISVRSAVQSFLIPYSKEEAFLVQGLSKGQVNCVSRTLILMAVFMPLEDLLKAQGLQPAIMGFANHMEFVLYHQPSQKAFSLLSMSDMSPFLGKVSLYHPYIVFRQFLVNHHLPTTLSVGDFALGPSFQIDGPSNSQNPFVHGLLTTSLKYESDQGSDAVENLDFSTTQIFDAFPMSNVNSSSIPSTESRFQLQPGLTYIQTWKSSSSVPLFPWEILPAPATMQDSATSKNSWNIYHQVQIQKPVKQLTHRSFQEALKADLQEFFQKYDKLSVVLQPILFQPDIDRQEVLALLRLMKFYEKYLLIESTLPKDLRNDLQQVFQDFNLNLIRFNLQSKLQYFYMWTQSSRESAIFHRWWNSLNEQQQMNIFLQKQLLQTVYRNSAANAEQQAKGANAYLNFYRQVSKKELCIITNEIDPLNSIESDEWKQVNTMKRFSQKFQLLSLKKSSQTLKKSGFTIQLQLHPIPNKKSVADSNPSNSDLNPPIVADPRKEWGIKVSRSLMSIMNVSQQYEGPQNCLIQPEEQMLLQQKVLQIQILMKKMDL